MIDALAPMRFARRARRGAGQSNPGGEPDEEDSLARPFRLLLHGQGQVHPLSFSPGPPRKKMLSKVTTSFSNGVRL